MEDERSLQVREIVSGGQTGVDRGALDAAIELGIDHGGWCPRGRRAEDGRIPSQYKQRETDSASYHVRTEQNVVDSDATLIVVRGPLSGGTALTVRMAVKHSRPYRVVDLEQEADVEGIRQWLHEYGVQRLNVAGPRESSSPGIARLARALVKDIF